MRDMIRLLQKPLLPATTILNKMVVGGQLRIITHGRAISCQDSLPRLPVPPLEQTMRKYLDTCNPLLTSEQYKCTEEIVARFLKKEGPVLQRLLELKAAHEINWLSGWWKQWAYLDIRVPVVVNVNPGIYFPRQSYRGQKEQIQFAARFIAGILDYKIMLDEQTLPVDKLGGKPLCMAQNYQILKACRIPGVKRDSHVCIEPDDPNQPKHIVVIHNNHFFSVDVYGDHEKPASVAQLSQQLEDCINHSKKPGTPVGILTTMDRTSWGKAYARMMKDKTNKDSLVSIQRSIFVVCLDGPQPSESGNHVDYAASIFLHGGGSTVYSSNRWFDKTMQFIFSQDGYIGLNYEHTTAEGPAVIGLCDHVLNYVEKGHELWVGATNIYPPRRLIFNVSNKIQDVIAIGSGEVDSAANDLMLRGMFFKDFGKKFIKNSKLSPDGFIQMAFQLAYYRMHKQPCATYETGSLRRFKLGRSDTIRSCSIASLAFTKGMDDPLVPHHTKVDLLKQAILSHKKYTDETINGQGIDRHLLGLKLLATENGMDIPELYMDLAFKESTHFRMSTSQVSSKYKSFLCFGPVVPDGYGLCYNPQEDELIISISSYNNSPQTNSDLLLESLTNSLKDMRKLLTDHQKL